MNAPDSIQQLVDRFEEQRAAYRSGKYNETQLRSDFLNPLFEALGWDVLNHKGNAEKYREVILERSVEMEGQAKAADYAFRVGDKTLFFVEAKKPAVNIGANPESAFQVRRYGWSAKLSISILSDFEQLAVYDCRMKPSIGDPASLGRVKLYSFQEYAEKWDEISAIFSRQAVFNGSFDQFAEGLKGKRGTADVDDAFLEEMERWRADLARNVALRNPTLSQRELNSAVQTTLDRIIFLRICEERGIEAEDALRNAAAAAKKDVYQDLVMLFKQADKKYNSGLFHFSDEKGQASYPDTLTLNLKIDDRVLKDIIAHLYYPLSPYAFKYIPVDILGQVYERFLGKVIRLTAGHQAKVEEKPEVRKAGGVYYTPTYIVAYIVKNTLGELLKDTSAEEQTNKPRRVLDPACGSGSFLLGAYQYLLDWYLDWYIQNEPAKWARGKVPAVFEGRGGWQLTMDKKKEILLSHIYGVDIDAQAVEVTKLSLLLKVVENPGQLSLLNERILPDLGENIKCGNSLIGPDYYEGRQMPIFGDEEFYRVNVFDWQKSFSQVFAAGGFDAVIGNPPYVRQETLGEQKGYFQKYYSVYHGTADLYVYFIEQGVSLLRKGGLFSYIVANKWMRTNYAEPLRKWLKNQDIEEIVDFGDLPVFEQATTYPCIIRIGKNIPTKHFEVTKVDTLTFSILQDYVDENHYEVNQLMLGDKGWSLTNEQIQKLLEKIRSKGNSLEQYSEGKVYWGIKTGLNDAFVIDEATKAKLIAEDRRGAELIKPFLIGREIKRYIVPQSDNFLIFIPRGWTREKSKGSRDAWGWFVSNYPAIGKHLLPFAADAIKRCDKGEYWWELRACAYYDEFEKPKIVYPNICKQPEFTFELTGSYTNQKCFIIPMADKYLLGILNSSVCLFLFRMILPKLRGDFYEPSYIYFKDFPICQINFSDPADAARHARMVALVEGMLALHKQAAAARLPQEKEMIQRQIQATDAQIDRLVYELYELTAEEIKIVEGG